MNRGDWAVWGVLMAASLFAVTVTMMLVLSETSLPVRVFAGILHCASVFLAAVVADDAPWGDS